MTGTSSLPATRTAPPATGRNLFSSDDAGAFDAAGREGGFADVLDSAGRVEGAAAATGRENAGERTRAVRGEAAGDNRDLEERELGEDNGLSAPPSAQSLAAALASFGLAPQALAPAGDGAIAGPSLSDRPEDLLARLLSSPTSAEASFGEEAVVRDADAAVAFVSEDEAEALKISVENTGVQVRGQEKHLAVSKPVLAVAEAQTAQSSEVASDIEAAQAAEVAANRNAAQPQTVAAPRQPAVASLQNADKLRSGQREAQSTNLAGAASQRETDVSTLGAADRSVVPVETGANEPDSRADDGNHGEAKQSGNSAGQAPSVVNLNATLRAGQAAFSDGLEGSDHSPAQQVATRVTTELGGAEAGGSTDGAVKVLHIELQPENLGSVTVRISLKDDAVTLHLEAQRPETVRAIEREHEALSAALKQAGYSVDGITTQQADTRLAQRVEAAQSNSSLGQSSGQSTDQGLSNPSGQRGQQGNGQPDQRAQGGTSANDIRSGVSQGHAGALYV